jgi:hypothetical protein
MTVGELIDELQKYHPNVSIAIEEPEEQLIAIFTEDKYVVIGTI